MKKPKLIIITCALVACSPPDISEIAVGAAKFCVPTQVLAGSDYYWLKDLPNDGFRFRVPFPVCANCNANADRSQTRTREISGVVDIESRYSDRKKPLTFDDRAYKILFAKDTKLGLIENDLYIMVEEASEGPHFRDFYIWKASPNKPNLAPTAILAQGGHFAFCSERLNAPHIPANQRIHCQRLIFAEPVAISYDFYFQDLSLVPEVDRNLKALVSSWRCDSARANGKSHKPQG